MEAKVEGEIGIQEGATSLGTQAASRCWNWGTGSSLGPPERSTVVPTPGI